MAHRWWERKHSSVTATHGMALCHFAQVTPTRVEEIGNKLKTCLIPSCTLSPSAGGESGRGLVLNLEARNPRSDILYNTGLLLQVQPVHFACNLIQLSVQCFPSIEVNLYST